MKKTIKEQLSDLKESYEQLRTSARTYRETVSNRRAVVHSTTPTSKMQGEIKGMATIQVQELVTVVKTAQALHKHVVLETSGTDLVIQLVDEYPKLPLEFYW